MVDLPGMAITAFDVRQATLEDTADITELTYACKGAEDLGVITSFTSLRRLNVGFNRLASLSSQLAALQQLSHLDVSNNLLVSLQPVEALTQLTSLNASGNRLRSTAPLDGLPQLQVLMLHGNQLMQPAEVLLLSRLAALEALTLRNNPVCQQCQDSSWHLATIALLPGLQALDGRLVDAEKRQAAADLPASISWHQAAADAAAGLAHPSTACSGSGSSSSSGGDGNGANGADAGAAIISAAASSALGRKLRHTSSSSAGRHSNAIAVPDSMSIKDATMLLPNIRAAPLKPSTLTRKTTDAGLQAPSVYGWSRTKPLSCVHSQRYTAARATPTPAALVRSDGSVSCVWPEGGLAVSLDPEEPAATGSSRGGYRLLAMYRSGSCVAASFDSTGGFVQQHPSGSLMLVWSKKDGAGTAYGENGSITHSFNSRKRSLALREDITAKLNECFSVKLSAGCADLQLAFSCEGCHLELSLLHGAMLPDRLAAAAAPEPPTQADHDQDRAGAAAAATASAPAAAPPQPPVDGDEGLTALMARARLLMATTHDADAAAQPG